MREAGKLHRRNFLTATGAAMAAMPLSVQRAATAPAAGLAVPETLPGPAYRKRPPLAPIKASLDRLVSLEACIRPFRPQGPRIEMEKRGRKLIVHNYGHGGSGWSLSWGSAQRAARLALETGETGIAVIGCGAIGLTSALMAQRLGMKVQIYTKEFIPDVRSFRATGVWSPSARICTLEHATPAFRREWEAMARFSYSRYAAMLGLPGNPIEWTEGYKLSDTPFANGASLYTHAPYPGEPEYPKLEDDHTPDLMSAMQELKPGEHPFPVAHVRRVNMLMFNISAYAHLLMQDFFAAGGRLSIREFKDVQEFQSLPERTIIHSTGYGARSLLRDDSLVPVRGQTARLIPQPEVDYAISYDSQNVYTVPRRDGIVVQEWSPGDYGNADQTPNLAATTASIEKLAKLFQGQG